MTTCLLVDDSKIVRKVARGILETIGLDIIGEAEDGKIALEFCAQTMPEFILLDWHMPVMNGLEFITALRESPGGREPKVMFCTTENDITHIMQAIAAGADEYVMKPFDEEIIRGKLSQIGLLIAMTIRVMLVDDSAVVRSLIARALEADADIDVVATASNGRVAVDMVQNARPDVMILDIEMPVMDGITALPELVKRAPQCKIIMASTLSQRNAAISMEALQKGAADYLPKPTSGASELAEFHRQLKEKIRVFGVNHNSASPTIRAAAPTATAITPPSLVPSHQPGYPRPCHCLIHRWATGTSGGDDGAKWSLKNHPHFHHSAYAAKFYHPTGRATYQSG